MIFGENEDENEIKSRCYTMKGLGLKGLTKTKDANKKLQQAFGLLESNLRAKIELEK